MQEDDRLDELIESLLPAVDQQLESSETGYVGKTYERLQSRNDVEEDEIKELIACCLAVVSDDMLKSGKPFDHKRYRKLLNALPELPES